MNWRIVLTLALLVAAAVSGWSVWKHRTDNTGRAVVPGRSDYLLQDFEIISLDDTGKEAFTLRAPKMQETPGARTMDLTEPHFLIPDTQGGYWEVHSRTGWVDADQTEVRLNGAVRGHSDPAGTRNVRMATEQLTVFPRKRTATTAASVTVEQPGSIIRAVGMDVDLAAKSYVLRSQVRYRHDRSLR